VVSHSSYENVRRKWVPELDHHVKGVPIILVGTKTDLRDDPKALAELKEEARSPLTAEDGARLAGEIGAVQYMECSALSTTGLKAIFDQAIRCGLSAREKPKPKKRWCMIL